MNKTRFDKQLVAGILAVVLLAALIFVSVFFNTSSDKPAAPTGEKTILSTATTMLSEQPTPTATPVQNKPRIDIPAILTDTLNDVDEQTKVDDNLLKELHSGAYTFEKPLVVVDPYNESPLTALVLFTSDEPLNVSVHVPGEDSLTDIDFTFTGYNTDHIIPIYGLYPNKKNQVMLSATTEGGKKSQTTLEIETEPLPQELQGMIHIVDLAKPDQYQPGLNFTFNNSGKYSKIAFDAHGKIRWYLLTSYNTPAAMFNNHFIFGRGNAHRGAVVFVETNPLGRIFRLFYAPYGSHHDIEAYQDHLLFAGSNSGTVEDFIYEIDPKNGKIVNTLDLRTVFQRSRFTGMRALEDPDWFHLNDITWVKGTNDILVSGRHQSVVARISWPDGEIKWMLGIHDRWLPMFQKYLLTPLGSNFEWQFNQHAPEILPDQDNNPNTMDILLFDNGNQRFDFDAELQRQIDAHEIVAPELFSRMVQFRIDEKAMTVTQVWEFGEEYGRMLYSPGRGDANLLQNGNRLGVFDVLSNEDPTILNDANNSANFFEVNSQGQIVWEVLGISTRADGILIEYRLDRAQLYNEADNNLEIGTKAINFIPESVYAKNNVKR